MCGRFALFVTLLILGKRFDILDAIDEMPEWNPRYNIAPSQNVLAVRKDPLNGRRKFAVMRGGLIPGWAKDTKIGYNCINARCEEIENKPAYRSAFKSHRCLILADGFYEWKKPGGKGTKQPYFFKLQDNSPMAFAGVWERWEDKQTGGQVIESCSILTTSPNELTSQVHDRMPVIVKQEHDGLWLDHSVQGCALLFCGRKVITMLTAE